MVEAVYYYCVAEYSCADPKAKAAKHAGKACEETYVVAVKELASKHFIRHGLALSYSDIQYEVLAN